MTLLASSGDVGAAQFACQGDGYVKGVADPLVTGVGGTTLRVSGNPRAEQLVPALAHTG